MFSRVTLVEIDTLRTDVDEAAELFAREVLPELRRQPGFDGALVLATAEGRGVIITLWEREEDAASPEPYGATLERYMTLFRAPPGRERYRVALAELPPAPPRAPA